MKTNKDLPCIRTGETDYCSIAGKNIIPAPGSP